jgi:transcriptional regulator with XRE-family HTH domain
MTTGEKIKKLRKEQNLTQMELAQMVGIRQGQLTQIEAGSKLVNYQIIGQIAKILHTSCDYLITGG